MLKRKLGVVAELCCPERLEDFSFVYYCNDLQMEDRKEKL